MGREHPVPRYQPHPPLSSHGLLDAEVPYQLEGLKVYPKVRDSRVAASVDRAFAAVAAVATMTMEGIENFMLRVLLREE